MNDLFYTIEAKAEGYYTANKSKFLSFLFPVKSEHEVKAILEECRKRYYNARHVCWAYMLGFEREYFRANDDGEPSGTAGRPILGQINSHNLTDVLIVVVRYFGGALLGTSGLINAYKMAASEAIAHAKIIEKTVDEMFFIQFDYTILNDVMRVLKQFEEADWKQDFHLDCKIHLRIRKSQSEALRGALCAIYGVKFR